MKSPVVVSPLHWGIFYQGGKKKVTPLNSPGVGHARLSARAGGGSKRRVRVNSSAASGISRANVTAYGSNAAPALHANNNEKGCTEDDVDKESGRVLDPDDNESYSFLHWNVNGLTNKFIHPDFSLYVSTFDFVCLVETFLVEFDKTLFPDHHVFVKPAVKLPKERGRCSGGVICLIKKSIDPELKHIKHIWVDVDNILLFRLDKTFFHLPSNILYVCTYVPPEHSPYYPFVNVDDGISQLENCLIDQLTSRDDVTLLMCGDFNGRTADLLPDLDDQNVSYCFSERHEDVGLQRKSEDKTLNSYGKLFLNMCSVLGLVMFNGVCNGDQNGRFTYLSNSGNSVDDYFVSSCELFDFISSRGTFRVHERIESDHLPLELYINSKNVNMCTSDEGFAYDKEYVNKYVWDSDLANEFSIMINSVDVSSQVVTAMKSLECNVNDGLCMFIDAVKKAGECMKQRVCINSPDRKIQWFDMECRIARRNVRRLLRIFKKTLDREDNNKFCIARREYKNLLITKKRLFNSALLMKISDSVNDQQDFWKAVRSVSKKKSQYSNNISIEEWHAHFKSILDKDVGTGLGEAVSEDVDNEDLDRPISKEEILFAIRKLKNSKAPGQDGLIAEFFKHFNDTAMEFLVTLFNILFTNGIYPNNWTESVILPLFKKGDKNNTHNYRGISLSDVISKLYSSVINKRLTEWIRINNITGEMQAGFKKGYSTIDHVFTLMAAIQKQFVNDRKLYVAFIDFEKAFDSISRHLLWPVLKKNEIKGKLYRCIVSMYIDVKARIRSGSKLSDVIKCTRGVKQGDALSPILFSLFVNELALEIINGGKHGATFDLVEIFLLLFADDIVLVSETPIGLQTQLNNLHLAACKLELKVNMDKSNIIVFRKGGYLAARERWIYNGVQMPVVNAYKYLGLYFTTKLSFKYSCQDLVSRAKRVVFSILSLMYKCDSRPTKVFFKLFDTQVQPVVNYGAEVWGLYAGDEIEKVHLFAMKKFLHIDQKTPNDLVYGELGRYPIYINSYVKCIKYWLQIVQMDGCRLPSQAYKLLYRLDMRGKKTWATSVKQCLCSYGFAFVWNNQGVGCIKSFLVCFKQRLIDCRWQDWDYHIQTSDRFSQYRLFKSSISMEPYFVFKMNSFVRNALTKFRFGLSDIASHRNRYKQGGSEMCRLCWQAKEDEIHFVLECPALNDLRMKYIPKGYCSRPSLFRLILLMSSTKENTICDFAFFLYKSNERLKLLT